MFNQQQGMWMTSNTYFGKSLAMFLIFLCYLQYFFLFIMFIWTFANISIKLCCISRYWCNHWWAEWGGPQQDEWLFESCIETPLSDPGIHQAPHQMLVSYGTISRLSLNPVFPTYREITFSRTNAKLDLN